MSTIFKALDRHSGRIVALKTPHSEFQRNPRSFRRLAREAALMAKLEHSGIPAIIPIGEKSRAYLVLEYVEGQTLYDLLNRRHALCVCEAIQMASRLCEILEYMHQQGVVHCDLKPGNIIVSGGGMPHIVDFGIANGYGRDPLGLLDTNAGTPEYMSPEQIHGDRLDGRTDIFSLGAVLYEAVTGCRPFRDDLRLENEPHSPRELNPNLSKQIEEIILHALAPHRADRYSSAAAMKAELDSPGTVKVTGSYRNPRRASPWSRRLRFAGFIFCAAAVPVILFYFFLWILQQPLAK